MSATPKEYQSLPGRGLRSDGLQFFSVSRSYCKLWMGGDHLLLVDRTGYTETYKRFYYRDIQAVIIRKTNSAAMWNYIKGVFVAIFGLWGLAVENVPGRMSLWIIAGCFGIATLVSLLRGPSCVSHIKTAVQIEQLPPWNRLPAARKGMMKVRPRLLQAQGEVSADELRVRLEDLLRRKVEGSATDTT